MLAAHLRPSAWHGNQKTLIAVLEMAINAEKAGRVYLDSQQERPAEGTMMYQILFLALSVVIAANILVVVIALSRAYREERRPQPRRFSGFASG